MVEIILKYTEDKSKHPDYGRTIEYARFKGGVQLRKNGGIVIITSIELKNKLKGVI